MNFLLQCHIDFQNQTTVTVWSRGLLFYSLFHEIVYCLEVVEFDGELHLILVAKRDIDEAEELLYDYGDRTPETVARNPWLVNS